MIISLEYWTWGIVQRYVTVLPPVHLGINIDTDIFVPDMPQDGDQLLASNPDFPSVEGTVKIDHPLGHGQETASGRDPKYYHNALSCVVLGVVVMIILFFVCKFLNDLQVNPRSGRGRRGKGHRCDTLVESVPISLRGHTQVGMACSEKCAFDHDGMFLAICMSFLSKSFVLCCFWFSVLKPTKWNSTLIQSLI